MNLMASDTKKKKILIGVSIGGLIAIIIILIIFWDKLPFNNPDDPNNDPDNDLYVPPGVGGVDPSDNDYYVLDEDKTYVTPNLEVQNVKFVGFEDNGMSRTLKVKDETGKILDFEVTYDTIFFDASKNKVVLSSTLKTSDKVTLSAFTSKDENATNKAVTVTLNSSEKLHYTPVMTLEKTEEYVYIINLETKTRYKVDRNATFTNALSGDVMYDTDILHGDRLFIYEGETRIYESPNKYQEGEFSPKELYEKDPIGKNGNIFPTLKEDKVYSKDLKTINVEQVFIYPSTAP